MISAKSPSSEEKEQALRKNKGREPATGSVGKSTSREGAACGKCGFRGGGGGEEGLRGGAEDGRGRCITEQRGGAGAQSRTLLEAPWEFLTRVC